MNIQKILDLMSENATLRAGSEFNLGNLISDLEKFDKSLIIKIKLADNDIVYPTINNVEICLDGNDDNYQDSNFSQLNTCFDS